MKRLNVLVACEFSGTVRDAFIAAGHDAMSCDLLPSETEGPHHCGDVIFDGLLDMKWDLLIAHPPCTYLANSGVRWLYHKGGSRNETRWKRMYDSAMFFLEFVNATHIPMRCIENPIPHKHAGLPPYTQTIQPYEYGHGETKRTCLWLYGLPPLQPTNIVEGREARVHRMPPGKDRWKERSRFFPGIAKAMAEQWGEL